MSQGTVNGRDASSPRPTRDDVIDLAHVWFRDSRRVDVQQLSRELGIGRATIYRWFSGREMIIGEVVWRIVAEALRRVEVREGCPETIEQFVHNHGEMAAAVRGYRPLSRFVSDDPEYALRVLSTRYSVVQGRLIEWNEVRLRAIPEIGPHVDISALAYAIVRVCESFIWSDMITGVPPAPDQATAMVAMLLAGACSTGRRQGPPGDGAANSQVLAVS
ncbi:QsdR family transcriptional regulator [Williamsia sp.]|uniref:QsdR family transcriptional regulator n=1 Tax=Williamsia sp. TaxID=1872085 RepID=UPI002F91E451